MAEAGSMTWAPWPAETGRSWARIEKSFRSGPLTPIWLTVTGDRLLLVMVRDLVVLELTATPGKDSADGWKDTGGRAGWFTWPSVATNAPAPASRAASSAAARSTRRANRGLVRTGGSSRRTARSEASRGWRDLPGRVSVSLADSPADS